MPGSRNIALELIRNRVRKVKQTALINRCKATKKTDHRPTPQELFRAIFLIEGQIQILGSGDTALSRYTTAILMATPFST